MTTTSTYRRRNQLIARGTSMKASLIALQLLLLAAPLTAEDFSTATIINDGGKKKIDVDRISVSAYITGDYKGKPTTLPLKRVKQVTFSSVRSLNRFPLYRGECVAETTDGKRFAFQNAYLAHRGGNGQGEICNIVYYCFNEVEERYQHFEFNVRTNPTLMMGKNSGDLKFNPKTKRFFPSEYRFDPYTGEKLIFEKSEKQ